MDQVSVRRAVAGLDEWQGKVCRFIREENGNAQIVACAGAGKTHTLVTTIAAMIALDGVPPEEIIAATFTNKAGKELVERLDRSLGTVSAAIAHVGSFHSLALRTLRREQPYAWDMGRCLDISGRAPGVPSTDDLWFAILDWTPNGVPGTGEQGMNLRSKGAPDGRKLNLDFTTKDYAMEVGLIRSRGYAPGSPEADDLAKKAEASLPAFRRAWAMYEQAKAALNAWDFDDALDGFVGLLRSGEGPRPLHVFVDEAQDNSAVQLEIATLLASKGRLHLIGDGRQAIYGWRGAAPEVFLGAHENLGATQLPMPRNYRSGRRIVALGNAIAEGADWAIGEQAVAAREGVEGLVRRVSAAYPIEEASLVAREIRAAIDSGTKAEDIAILCRTNNAGGLFEMACVGARIPVTRLGAKPLLERAGSQDLMAYLMVAEENNLRAFERIYNKPSRYLGKAFKDQVVPLIERGMDIVEAVRTVAPRLRGGSKNGALDLAKAIEGLRRVPYTQRPDRARLILLEGNDAAYEVDPLLGGGGEDNARDLLGTVAAIARGFACARDFLVYADACIQNIQQTSDTPLPGRVTISTVHKAKGLEWERVYVNATAGVFPHVRATGSRLEEERRLFYVAVTRAREELVLSYAATNERDQPAGASPFLAYARPFLSIEKGAALLDLDEAEDEDDLMGVVPVDQVIRGGAR